MSKDFRHRRDLDEDEFIDYGRGQKSFRRRVQKWDKLDEDAKPEARPDDRPAGREWKGNRR